MPAPKARATTQACSISPNLEDKYVLLARIVVSNLFFAKTLSYIVDQAEYDSLASALVNISMEGGNTLSIIRIIVESEFERNFRAPGSILRGNCVASKMMGAFSRKVGADYLRECIGSAVHSIAVDESLSLEIDPVKVDNNSAVVRANIKELSARSAFILSRITDTSLIKKMPLEIKAIAGITAEYAKIYCPDRLNPLIGGFIMLRLFNPSLVTPEAYGILPDSSPLPRAARRNLTLITKLLQNLSNGVPFGSKETYMTPMNRFIEEKQEKMNEFLTKLVSESQTATREVDFTKSCKKLEFQSLKSKDLDLLHLLLFNYKAKLLAILADTIAKYPDKEFREEEKLFELLDELGPPNRKIPPRADVDSLGISFLSPPEKSGYLSKKQPARTGALALLADNTPKRNWVALTSGFIHFFKSPQHTKPLRSISLDEILVNVSGMNLTDNFLSDVFFISLTYYRKDHLYYVQEKEEALAWEERIRNTKQKYAKLGIRQKNETLRPIETRIRNHSMGLKISYHVSLSSQLEYGKNSTIHFILSIEAFSKSYNQRKTLKDFHRLHGALVSAFPKLIFPTLPKKIGEETSAGMPFGRYNGRASLAVIIMCKFLRSFLHEIKSNLLVQQSTVVLDFLGLTNPINAVKHNHLPQLARLLEMSVDFNQHDSDGNTALHKAVELNRVEAVTWLCNCSTVHINSKDNNGNSPLIIAIKLKRNEMVEMLIESGAEVKLKNNVRSSALHIAAYMGFSEICSILIAKGIKIDELNMKRKSPLHLAISRHHHHVAFLLLNAGATTSYKDSYGNTLIGLATAVGMEKLVNFLLESTSIDVNAQGRYRATALHFAAASGRVDVVTALLEHGADPTLLDVNRFSVLATAVVSSHPDVVELLCVHCKEKGIALNFEAENNFLLHSASVSPRSADLLRILDSFSYPLNRRNGKRQTALHVATAARNVDAVSTLLELNAEVGLEDECKRTPLYIASYKGYAEIVSILLEYNADIHVVDGDGTSPLLAAIWAGSDDVVEVFCDQGIDLKKVDNQGNGPLHAAIQGKQISVVKMLIGASADVNLQRSSDGFTPLHVALDWELESMAEIFIFNPAVDLSLKNKGGENALHFAVNRNAPAKLIQCIKHRCQ